MKKKYLTVGDLIDRLAEFKRSAPIKAMTAFGVFPICAGDGVFKKSPDGSILYIDDEQATHSKLETEELFK